MITIDDFKKALFAGVTENKRYVQYYGNRDFTEKVEKAMKLLAEECQVEYHPEYYTVDYTFWERNQDEIITPESKVGMKNYNWNLVALIEHENNENDWHYEVQKLAPFLCPLRIVIGYRNTKYTDKERLEYVNELLHNMKEHNCFCEEGEFWIVIGNCGHEESDYKFYKYNVVQKQFQRDKNF